MAGASSADTQQIQALDDYVADVWDLFPDVPNFRLRMLETLREATGILLGYMRLRVSGSLGPLSQQLNQKFTNLKTLFDLTTAQIEELRKRLRAQRPVVVGQLQATSPIMAGRPLRKLGTGEPGPIVPPYWWPDPGGPLLEGLPPAALTDAQLPGSRFPLTFGALDRIIGIGGWG